MTTTTPTTAARQERAQIDNFSDAIAFISRYGNMSQHPLTPARKEHDVPWYNHLRKIPSIG